MTQQIYQPKSVQVILLVSQLQTLRALQAAPLLWRPQVCLPVRLLQSWRVPLLVLLARILNKDLTAAPPPPVLYTGMFRA
jgi:hypothetical protein